MFRNAAVLPKKRYDIPSKLRRKRQGRCTGRPRRRHYRPALPSMIMGNVRSLSNKMNKLAALSQYQKGILGV